MLSDTLFEFEEAAKKLRDDLEHYRQEFGYDDADLATAELITLSAEKMAKQCHDWRMRPGFDLPPGDLPPIEEKADS